MVCERPGDVALHQPTYKPCSTPPAGPNCAMPPVADRASGATRHHPRRETRHPPVASATTTIGARSKTPPFGMSTEPNGGPYRLRTPRAPSVEPSSTTTTSRSEIVCSKTLCTATVTNRGGVVARNHYRHAGHLFTPRSSFELRYEDGARSAIPRRSHRCRAMLNELLGFAPVDA